MKMEAHIVYSTYQMWYVMVKMYSIVRLLEVIPLGREVKDCGTQWVLGHLVVVSINYWPPTVYPSFCQALMK